MKEDKELIEGFKQAAAHLDEVRRQEVIGAIKAIKLDSQMPEGWQEQITAEHVIILPKEMEDDTPDASRLSFIRFHKHLPPGRCLIVKIADMFQQPPPGRLF